MNGLAIKQATSTAGRTVVIAVLALCAGCDQILLPVQQATGWIRHTIDDRFRGADGVKLGDLDGDGLFDLVVPWEESGAVVVYLNPGPALATISWPAVTVGEVVPDLGDAVVRTFTIADTNPLESVEVDISLGPDLYWGDYNILLTSPSGTTSQLAYKGGEPGSSGMTKNSFAPVTTPM